MNIRLLRVKSAWSMGAVVHADGFCNDGEVDEVVKDEGAEIGHSRGEIVEVPSRSPSLIKLRIFSRLQAFCRRNSLTGWPSASPSPIVRTGCKELIL